MKTKSFTLLPLLLLVAFCKFSFGQGRQFIIKINSDHQTTPFPTLVDTPVGYNTSGISYPLLVFLHGTGESSGTSVSDANYLAGKYLNKIYNNASAGGPGYFVAQGLWPDAFTDPKTGQVFHFIVISPQAPGWSTAGAQLNYIIDNFIKMGYRVDPDRIYITGLSAGGQGVVDYASHTNTTPMHVAAAMVPMSIATGASTTAAAAIVKDSVRAWGFGQAGPTKTDVHGVATSDEINYMNAIVPGIGRFTNYIGSAPHCCWGTFYDPTYKETINGKSMNIYEWMLMSTRNPTATPPATTFTVSAGSDQSITLPTSQVTLSGSATPASGHSIATYLWTKLSGGTANIALTGNPTTTITGLQQGSYVFQLLAIDNLSVSLSSTVKVTVNAAAVPVSVPTANAGASQTIQLPVSQTTLDGSASSVTNGTIQSYSWTQLGGPSTATMGTSAAAKTTISNLSAGVYTFQLLITDNNNKTSTASVKITVNAAVTPPSGPSTPSSCNGKRKPISISADDQGIWLQGSTAGLSPGDTLVVSSKHRWSYLSADGLHGTNSCPIVITNDAGQVEMTAGIALANSTYVHVTGTGSPANFYGFYIHSYPTVAPTSRGNSLQISDRSSHIEIDHIDEYLRTYAMWLKEEAQCADSLRYPYWRLDNMSIHDIRAKNINQDGFYIGSTSPNGERSINCNGQTISPIPMRVSNIHIYNIILDSVGRTGIQISGGDSGVNEINNCRVTRTGYEFNPTQGSGIILGGYTEGYVHDNYIRNTYQHGISLLGAGLMRVENNDIDSSGYLNGIANPDYSSISADTRKTTNQGTTASIYSTVYVRNNKVGVSTNRTGTATAYRSIDIGYGYANLPTWNNDNIICGNVLQDGKTAAEFRINPNIKYVNNCSFTPNQAPAANAGSNQTIKLPVNTVTLKGSGTDADGTVAGYQWSWISGPSQYTIVSAGQAQTVINNLTAGTYVFQLQVTDDKGATGKTTVTITVQAATGPVNQAPVANAGTNQTITLPVNTVTLKGSGTDADGTIAGYQWSWVSGPSQYTIVSAAQVQTVINNLAAGTYVFQLQVTDDKSATGKSTVTITVQPAIPPPPPVNQAPVANAGNNQTITLPVNTVTLKGSGTDADGTVAGYQWSWISGPSQYTIVSAGQAQTVINNLAAGTYQFQLQVTDNKGATGNDVVTIQVLSAPPPPANKAPVASAGGDQTITLPVNTVTLSGSGTDADGTVTGYQWSWVSGPSSYTIANSRQAGTSIGGLVEGTYQFQLTVTDNSGATATDVVTIVVQPAVTPPPAANIPPVANAGTDITTSSTSDITLDGSASYDPDGTIVNYGWLQESGAGGVTIVKANTANPMLYGLKPGTYVFGLQVTDNGGATDRASVTVTVVEATPPPVTTPSQAPVAVAGSDTSVTYPAVNSVVLDGSRSYDQGGTITSYEWTQLSGPANAAITTSGGSVAQAGQLVIGVYKFVLRVTDDKGLSASDTVLVTVHSDLRHTTSITLYPNPVHDGQVTLQGENDYTGMVKYMLYDISGRVILQLATDKQTQSFTQAIPMRALQKGMYILSVQFGNDRRVFKIMVD